MNNIHLIIIAVEGVFLIGVVIAYVWYMVQKVWTWSKRCGHGAKGVDMVQMCGSVVDLQLLIP